MNSFALVLTKNLFGPLVAGSIVLLPTFWALLFIGIIGVLNVIMEINTIHKINAQKWLATSGSIAYLLFHLSITVFGMGVLKGGWEWTCGYVTLSFFALIIFLRLLEGFVIIIYGLFKKKSNGTQPKNSPVLIKIKDIINTNCEDTFNSQKKSMILHVSHKLKNS